MGAGKSKIGPLLASKFSCPFYDSDTLIEQKAGKRVHSIFSEDGEEVFRKMESSVIERLARENVKSVIALGGGALISEKNRTMAAENGIIVYLKSDPRAILNRIKHSRKRPLLNIAQDENFEQNLLKMIQDLLAKRKAIYEKADLIFDRDPYEYTDAAVHLYQELANL